MNFRLIFFQDQLLYLVKKISKSLSMQIAGILLDTRNLSSPRCTDKDKYMATLLINGAGRFGCTGLHQICMLLPLKILPVLAEFFSNIFHIWSYHLSSTVKYKMYDVSDLKVGHILRKDFKKWTRIGKMIIFSLLISYM